MIRAERTISTHFQSILHRKKPGKLLFLRCYKSCRYCKLYILNSVLINIPTETRNQFISNMIRWKFLYYFQSLDYIFGNEIVFYTQQYNFRLCIYSISRWAQLLYIVFRHHHHELGALIFCVNCEWLNIYQVVRPVFRLVIFIKYIFLYRASHHNNDLIKFMLLLVPPNCSKYKFNTSPKKS